MHIQGVVQVVVNAKFFVDLGCSITFISGELSSFMVVKLNEMVFADGPCTLHIVGNYFVLSNKMLPLDTPTNSTRNASDFAHYCRFIVKGVFLWVHLFCEVAFVGRLVDAGDWISDLIL